MYCMPGPQFYNTYLFLLHQSAQASAMRMLEKTRTWTTLNKQWIWWNLMASCIVLLNALRKDKKYKNKNVRFWVGGSQYMPAKSYAEKCEEPSIARMEEFRSPVQPSYSYSTLQPSIKFWYSMCGWGWWKNLEPGDFHLVEFRPDSAIVSYWAILSCRPFRQWHGQGSLP